MSSLESPSKKQVRIFVVEDEATSQRILRALLGREYDTSFFNNAEDALTAIALEAPDIIISDVEMPGIGGLELTHRLKASEETSHIPVLLVTGRAGKEALVECLDAGADDYLPKPIRTHELRARLRAAIRTRQLHDSARQALADLQTANGKLVENLDELQRIGEHLRLGGRFESIAQLAAGMAHEINTPAQFVGDNLKFVSESVAKMLDQLARYQSIENGTKNGGGANLLASIRMQSSELDLEYLASELPLAIKESQAGLARIVAVVHLMQAYSASGSSTKTPVDVHAMLTAVLAACKSKLSDVVVTTNFHPTLPAVPCVAGELEQVFANIVENAAWAISKVNQSKATHVAELSIETLLEQDAIVVRISDTGCGIPRDIQARIFDPFFTTKSFADAKGQGLALAHSVVAQHGGSITVRSEVGVGSSFSVRLPLAGYEGVGVISTPSTARFKSRNPKSVE